MSFDHKKFTQSLKKDPQKDAYTKAKKIFYLSKKTSASSPNLDNYYDGDCFEDGDFEETNSIEP